MEDFNKSDIIIKAIDTLDKKIDTCNLSASDKKILKALCIKIVAYYNKKKSILLPNYPEKMMYIESCITDMLVELNALVLSGSDDTYSFINSVNKQLHDSEIEKILKKVKR